MRNRMLLIGVVLALGLLAVLFVFLNARYPGTLADPEDWASVGVNIVWLVLLTGSLVVVMARNRLSDILRSVLIWLCLFLVILLGYAYRSELTEVGQRLMGEIVPAEPRVVRPGMVALRLGNDRHFQALAEVNGQRIQFLVDTGATETTLTYEDARRVGIEVERLNFNIPVSTANGMALSARTRLKRVVIGDLVFEDLGASVAQPDRLHRSLLGMNLLNRLTSFEIRGDEMILRR